jgi:outer membrane protein assembly factor BamB
MSRSLVRPALALLVLVPTLAAACGGSHETADPPAAPADELFVVRPAGPAGPLRGYDAASGQRRFTLPPGVATADGRRFYTASRGVVRTYDAVSGELLGTHPAGRGWHVGGVSPTGRWLALSSEGVPVTRVRLIDTHGWRPVDTLQLAGRFEVDAVSADGRALFLIQHLTNENYLVWLYDRRTGRLSQPGETQPKARPEVMTGYAWGGVASRDGRWLLTLYLNTQRNVAFVHALDVQRRRPLCIDLPSGSGRVDALEHYSLALAPNGRTLLAPNPALGVVAEVDLRKLRVVRTGELSAAKGANNAASAVSPDGRALYVASGRALWAYDTAEGRSKRLADAGGRIAGLAVSRDGGRVYVVRADERVLVVDAATGSRL